MPENNKPYQGEPQSSRKRKVQSYTNQLALGMELPITFVGAIFIGGMIGYYLDKWLHTAPWLLVLFGCLGFVAGILEIVRRFGPKDSGDDNIQRPS